MADQPYLTWKHGGDVINVKGYGAVGNGSTDDTGAIEAAIAAFYGTAFVIKGTLYFPPGDYKVTRRLDFKGGSGQFGGRVCGAGPNASFITGYPGVANANLTIANDAVVNISCNSGWLGPQEFSDLTIRNQSTVVGSVGLRCCTGSGVGVIRNCHLEGMTALDLGAMNTFNGVVDSCTFSRPQGVDKVQGTVAILGSGGKIFGTHFSTECGETAILVCGECVDISSCSFENVCVGISVGVSQGLATSCTITGANGSKVLTVNGSYLNYTLVASSLAAGAAQVLYPDPSGILSDGADTFRANDILYGTGIPPNQMVTIGGQLTNTSGDPNLPSFGAGGYGTYSLVNADNITISTPQAFIRRRQNMSVNGCCISSCESEAVGMAVYIDSGIGVTVKACSFTGVYNQAPAISGAPYLLAPYEPIMAGAIATGIQATALIGAPNVTINTPAFAVGVRGGSNIHLDSVNGGGFFSQAAFKFFESNAPNSVTFTNCGGTLNAPAITDANSFIDDGTGLTAVTNATTSTSSNVLHFSGSGGGVPPSSMPVGTPVYNVTTSASLVSATVASQTSTSVTLNVNVAATVGSGDTIKFGVPSGFAGHVLTVCGLSSGSLKLGGVLSGTSIPTGRNSPFVADQIPLGFKASPGQGGGAGSQYNLGNHVDGAAISLNLGRRAITCSFGAPFAINGALRLEDQLGVGGITGKNLDQYDFSHTCARELQLPLGVVLAITSPAVGTQYDVYNCPGSGGGGAAPAPTFGQVITAVGSAAYQARLRYNGVNWTVMGV